MTTATIFDLETYNHLDLTTVRTGPLRAARLVTFAPQHSETLTTGEHEHTLFVLEVTGTARMSMAAADLAPGTAVVEMAVPLLNTAMRHVLDDQPRNSWMGTEK